MTEYLIRLTRVTGLVCPPSTRTPWPRLAFGPSGGRGDRIGILLSIDHRVGSP